MLLCFHLNRVAAVTLSKLIPNLQRPRLANFRRAGHTIAAAVPLWRAISSQHTEMASYCLMAFAIYGRVRLRPGVHSLHSRAESGTRRGL